MKHHFTTPRPWRKVGASVVGLTCLVGLGLWLWWGPADPAPPPSAVTPAALAAAADSPTSPFGAPSDTMPPASAALGAASQAVPVWGGPSLANARPPAGVDTVAFKKALALAAYTQYKDKFFKTFESGQTIAPAQLKIIAQEADEHYNAGYLSLLDYYAANDVLLRAQYQGAALDAQLEALAQRIDNMAQLKKQATPEDVQFKAYKAKETAIIQKADKMKEFPGGVSKETYILQQIEAIK